MHQLPKNKWRYAHGIAMHRNCPDEPNCKWSGGLWLLVGLRDRFLTIMVLFATVMLSLENITIVLIKYTIKLQNFSV
jgi:hypothetical protein